MFSLRPAKDGYPEYVKFFDKSIRRGKSTRWQEHRAQDEAPGVSKITERATPLVTREVKIKSCRTAHKHPGFQRHQDLARRQSTYIYTVHVKCDSRVGDAWHSILPSRPCPFPCGTEGPLSFHASRVTQTSTAAFLCWKIKAP